MATPKLRPSIIPTTPRIREQKSNTSGKHRKQRFLFDPRMKTPQVLAMNIKPVFQQDSHQKHGMREKLLSSHFKFNLKKF